MRKAAAIIGLVGLAVAGYFAVSRMLPGTPAGDEATLWVVAFFYGALLVSLGWHLFRISRKARSPASPHPQARAELSELSEEISNLSEASTIYFLLSQRLTSIIGWERAALFVLEEEHNRYTCRRATSDMSSREAELLMLKRTDPFFQNFMEDRSRYRGILLDLDMIGNDASALRHTMLTCKMTHLMPLINRGRLMGFILGAGKLSTGIGNDDLLRAVIFHGAAALDTLLLLEHEAIDLHTGFMRAALFDSRIDEEIRRSRRQKNPFGLLLIDIDELHEINEKFGDQAGNEVIHTIARTIREKLRKTDLASRSGGEEFMVLLPDTDADKATLVAENLRAHIEMLRTKIEGSEINIKRTVSIGISVQRPDEPTFGDELIQQAHKALLQAKTNGKNTIAVYTDALPL